jgi:hypothetical protein
MLCALFIAVLPALPAATPSYVHLQGVPTASTGWLDRFNTWRASTGLTNVSEVPAWSSGDYNHALYMVKNDLVTHYETPGTPYYTTAGDTAAQSSNIFVSSTTATTDNQAIDWWMQAPFHAMAMMDPRLTQTGFGAYREAKSGWQMGAAVDTLRGNPFTGGQYPVYYPGNGTTEPLTSYGGGEYPDPLQACPYPAPTGLPVLIEVGGNVDTTVSPVHSFTGNGVPLNHCVIDSSNAAVHSYLYSRGGVILVPQQPLQNGVKYVVTLTVNGTPYTWSFTVGPFITSTTPCTSAGLTADKSSPQKVGTVITFTATSTGCPNPQYLFYLQSPGGAWSLARGYGGATWAWDTSAVPSTGNYVVDVWVRDAGSGASYQAVSLLPFSIGTTPACTGANYTPDKGSPQVPGATVTFTGTSAGCSQPTYKYFLQSPAGDWSVGQDWGGPTFMWNTTGLAVGTYHVDMWTRQSGSAAAYESLINQPYALAVSGACATASYVADKATPQQTGTIVTFTGSSTGCSQPTYLYYIQSPSGVWSLGQGWGGATFVWNSAGLVGGSYHVNVWVKQNGSVASYEALQNLPYVLTSPAVACSAANLGSDKVSPQPHGTTVTFTATSTACSQPLYLYYIQSPNGTWSLAQSWGGATFVWNTTGLQAGTYHVDVWVRQNGSPASYETLKNIPYQLT